MITSAAHVLRNSVFSLMADAVARASNTVLFILISRRLGAVEGGTFSLAMTYALLFTQLSFWGMDQLLTREVAKDRAKAGHYVGSFILFRGILSGLLFAIMVFLATQVVRYSPTTNRVILIMGLSIVPESIANICQALFVAFERIKYVTLVGMVVGVIRLVGGGVALLAGGSVEAIAIILCASSLAGLTLSLGIIYTRFPRPVWWLDGGFWRSHLKVAGPFMLIGVFYIIEFQSDTLLLSVFKSEKEIGIYNAATTFLFALVLLPQAFRAAIFPVMSRLHANGSPELAMVYEKSFKYLLIAALPIAAALTLSADGLMHLLYRSGFAASASVLRIVIWAFVLLMINVPSARLMIVANGERAQAIIQGLSMVLNIGMNLLLIPMLGAVGAAWARVGSTGLFVLLGLGYTFVKLHRWNPIRVVMWPLAAVIVMLLIGSALLRVSEILAVGAGLVGYGLLVWVSGIFPRDERAVLVRAVRQSIRAA